METIDCTTTTWKLSNVKLKLILNSYLIKVPCIELEFLANYLAELTLVEYDFLKFLPSLIAASSVFLAQWTLDQSNHPWVRLLQFHFNFYFIFSLFLLS